MQKAREKLVHSMEAPGFFFLELLYNTDGRSERALALSESMVQTTTRGRQAGAELGGERVCVLCAFALTLILSPPPSPPSQPNGKGQKYRSIASSQD